MASKVNTRFVILLSLGVVGVLAGVLGTAAFLLYTNRAKDLASMGDKALAKGEYVEAAVYYSKACDKERTNVEYFTKWRESLAKQTPETPVKYNDALQGWRGATRQLAVLQPEKIEARREYLDTLRRSILAAGFDRENFLYVRNEANLLLSSYAGREPGPWEQLRKYRGLASMRLAMETVDAPKSDWDEARADLEAALRADPTDHEAAIALDALLLELSERARRGGRPEEAAEHRKAADTIVANFMQSNPGSAPMMLAVMRRELAAAVIDFADRNKAAIDAGKPPLDPMEQGREFVEKNVARLDAAFEAAKKLGGERIDANLVGSMRGMEQTIDPRALFARTTELINLALAARPDDLDMLGLRADTSAQRQDFDNAIAQVQAIIDLPLRPVSIDGARLFGYKIQSRFFQALWAARKAEAMGSQPDAGQPENLKKVEEAIARARALRDELAKSEASDSPRLMLVDAWNAYLRGDAKAADRLLENVNRKGAITDPETMVLWAKAALRENNTGAARERLLTVLRAQPNNMYAAFVYGQLSLTLKDWVAAEQIFNSILRLVPDNAIAREGLDTALAMQGKGTVKDPVAQVLFEAERMLEEGRMKPDNDRAVAAHIDAAIAKLGEDPRLLVAKAKVLAAAGDRAGALALIRKGLASRPDDAMLKSAEASLSVENPVDGALNAIAVSTLSPLEKLLESHTVLREANRTEQAREALAKAVELAPEDHRVVELRLLDAMERQDWTAAEAMVELGTRLNVDRMEGRSMRARMLAQKGDPRAASNIMQEVVSGGGASPETYRLLGRFLNMEGRFTDAAAAFRRALELRPNDPGAIKDLTQALVASGQRDQALIVAREGAKHAQGDGDFVDLWLKIETEFGNVPFVIERRERIAVADPNDAENWYELARIYLRNSNVEKSRAAIDRLRKLDSSIGSISLDASWYWAKNDPAGASRIFTEHFATLKEKPEQLGARIAYAQFLFQRRDNAGAIKALEEARAFQDPKNLEADRALAETLFSTGELARAAEVMRSIISAGGDSPDSIFRKRLVESLMRLGAAEKEDAARDAKLAEAEKELAPLVAGEPDMISLMLLSDLRAAQGKPAEQRQILDRAVTRFPDEPAAFIKRGQVLSQKEDTLRDAIADYTVALQKNPGMWQAYKLRAQCYSRMKRTDEAVSDLRQALKLNPGDDDLLVGLVRDLISIGRDQEADRVAEDVIKLRPREALTYLKFGNLFMNLGKPSLALKYLSTAFDLDSSDGIAQRVLDALLSKDVADYARADALLQQLGSRTNASPGFLMALAKLRVKQARAQEANRAIAEALRLLDPTNAEQMMAWRRDLGELIPVPRDYRAFLDDVVKAGVLPAANPWLLFFRAESAAAEPGGLNLATSDLKRLTEAPNVHPQLDLFSYRMWGGLLFQGGKHDEAIAVWQKGLEKYPDDPEMLNNMAYLLAGVTGKPEEAVAYAEKAVKLSPNRADVLDTLGYVYIRVKRFKDAEDVLRRAVPLADNERSGLHIAMHMAEAVAGQGRKEDAKRAIQTAQEILGGMGDKADPDSRREFEEVRKRVEAQ